MLHAKTPPHKGGVFAFPTTTARPLTPALSAASALARARRQRRTFIKLSVTPSPLMRQQVLPESALLNGRREA